MINLNPKEPKQRKSFVNRFDGAMAWMRQDTNMRLAETISTIVFVFVFIVYAYGFRTGFTIGTQDIQDILFDIAIIVISSTVIIRSFAKKGMWDELDDNEKIKAKEDEHQKLADAVDPETIAERIREWNVEKINEKMRTKKDQTVKNLKRQRSVLLSMKKKKRKVRKLDTLIDYYSLNETDVKVKHHWVTETELCSKTAMQSSKGEVSTNYNVVRDVTSSQSAAVLGSTIVFVFIRFAVDPTIDTAKTLLMFLAFIIPYLFIRAIISYMTARYKTAYTYRFSVEQKIKILQWCQNKNTAG